MARERLPTVGGRRNSISVNDLRCGGPLSAGTCLGTWKEMVLLEWLEYLELSDARYMSNT